ncbi:CRISPR-associated endonuclease Cas1 [Streptococcus oralis]|nr:CRISPR-associated endonuclease Cas1 [Streptococcus oralis]MBZ2085074.1 CRISPR-associated endonuclease Cas1 [Streptococcus oralis]MBZ2088149.1 CRISPR-associated endonuclease Cas1 [Streptococcus oralis]
MFNEILNQSGFSFVKRTKRPPRDPLNALISFCNTILYSRVLRLIWQARLDPKIGVLHASNNRPYSLHLDFADYMKPVIVDRVMLSLINKHQINATDHFEEREDGSVYLNREGKYIVLRSFEEKLQTRLVIGGSTYTYAQLIQHDIRQFKRILQQDGDLKRFKPYKYY